MSFEPGPRPFPPAPEPVASPQAPPVALSAPAVARRWPPVPWLVGVAAGALTVAAVVAIAWPVTPLDPQVPSPPAASPTIDHETVAQVRAEPPPPPEPVETTKVPSVVVTADAVAPIVAAAEPATVPRGPKAQARWHVRQMEERAEAPPSRQTLITDAYGRPVGHTTYLAESETDLPLRLSAVVDPKEGDAFAVIENERTGTVATYGEGRMLWPGVLPGVWVVDIEPGVVHLLDLGERKFEYLTFTKSKPKPKAKRRTRRSTRRRTRRR